MKANSCPRIERIRVVLVESEFQREITSLPSNGRDAAVRCFHYHPFVTHDPSLIHIRHAYRIEVIEIAIRMRLRGPGCTPVLCPFDNETGVCPAYSPTVFRVNEPESMEARASN